MEETNTQMRRSFSMPVKPLHLEQKTLKRSMEKETVYATDDSEGDDNSDANYLRQRSSPAMVTENSDYYNVEPTMLRGGLPKHLRSVRDFFANSVNPIFSIFRKSNTNAVRISGDGSFGESCSIKTTDNNGQTSTKCYNLLSESPNDQSSHEQNSQKVEDLEKSNGYEQERVVFSL